MGRFWGRAKGGEGRGVERVVGKAKGACVIFEVVVWCVAFTTEKAIYPFKSSPFLRHPAMPLSFLKSASNSLLVSWCS